MLSAPSLPCAGALLFWLNSALRDIAKDPGGPGGLAGFMALNDVCNYRVGCSELFLHPCLPLPLFSSPACALKHVSYAMCKHLTTRPTAASQTRYDSNPAFGDATQRSVAAAACSYVSMVYSGMDITGQREWAGIGMPA